jgi:hypothetical protein
LTWPLITVKSRTETAILEMPGAGPGVLDCPALLKGARVTIFVDYPRKPLSGHVPHPAPKVK